VCVEEGGGGGGVVSSGGGQGETGGGGGMSNRGGHGAGKGVWHDRGGELHDVYRNRSYSAFAPLWRHHG